MAGLRPSTVRHAAWMLLAFCMALASVVPAAGQSADGREELWAAARRGDVAAVKRLLSSGVDVNARTAYGATALSYAADKGHVEVVRILLDSGADPSIKDTFYGSTSLGWAIYRGHVAVLKLLVEKGAKAEGSDLTGAAREGHVEIVRLLLHKGGFSAEDLTAALSAANRGQHAEIAALLQKAGATAPPPADFPVAAAVLQRYVGTYRNREGREWVFTLKDGKLSGGAIERPFVLGAVDQTTFQPLELDGVTLTFRLREGKVEGFTLQQRSGTLDFDRVDPKP